MAKITLTGAAFHGFEFTCGPGRGEGAPMVIAEFSAPWTEHNREAGNWDELPETVSGSIKLVPGDLAASNFEFIPGNGMEAHAVSLACSGATDFRCFVPIKEGEPRELRFKLKTAALDAGLRLEGYGRTCREATGKLNISYAEPPPKPGAQQMDLAPNEDRLISKEQAADTAATN